MDHFYAADGSIRRDGQVQSGYHCLESLTTQTALALTTERVMCGSLVYCAGYRHPAVLANAMATLDQLSGGRAVLGMGCGWNYEEYAAYGIPFPSVGERLRVLDEAVQCVRLLHTEEVANFDGTHFSLRDARCEPKPVQSRFPIWVAGGGEQRTLRTTARHAGGWNLAFPSPETFRHKREVLDRYCDDIGRDGAEIVRTAVLPLAWENEDLVYKFGMAAEYFGPNVLEGRTQQVIDRLGEYGEAGVQLMIVEVRAPFDVDGLDRFSEEVLPAFAES